MISELKFILGLRPVRTPFITSTIFIFLLSIIELISVLPFGMLIKFYLDIPLNGFEQSLVFFIFEELNLANLSAFAGLSVLISAVAIFLSLHFHSSLVWSATHHLSCMLFDISMLKADPFAENYDIAVIRKNIATEAQQYAFYGIGALANILGRATACLFLVLTLAILAPISMLLSLSAAVLFFATLILVISKKIKAVGKKREYFASEIFRNIDQTANSLPMIRGLKNEEVFLNKFATASENFRQAAYRFMLLPQLPRIFIDFLFFISLIVLITVSYYTDLIVSDSTLYGVLAVVKFIPGLNILFKSVNERQYALGSFDVLSGYLYKVPTTNEDIIPPSIKLPLTIKLDMHAKNASTSRKVFELSNVGPGDIVLFSGDSGSGKSTLLQCLSGISAKPWVTVTVHDTSCRAICFTNYKIGYLSQAVSLINGTLIENIMFKNDVGVGNSSGELELFRSILCDVGLHDLVDDLNTPIFNLASRFSGGEIQRLAIARLIFNNPDIIFLDEPTSALDRKNELIISDVIEKFSSDGKVIFMATHSASLKKIATTCVNLGA